MWLRLVIGIIVVYLLYRLVKRPRRDREPLERNVPPQQGEELVEDPVCHAYVPISRACRTVIDGKTLYFCSPSCEEAHRKVKKNDEQTKP